MTIIAMADKGFSRPKAFAFLEAVRDNVASSISEKDFFSIKVHQSVQIITPLLNQVHVTPESANSFFK